MKKISFQSLFLCLATASVTTLIIADIIGGKLIVLYRLGEQPIILSAGILAFLFTFVLTDLINEFYGKRKARQVTYLSLAMALFANLVLLMARLFPASDNSPIPQSVFETVFGMSSRIFIASLTAYLVGQLVDIQVFHFIRRHTQGKMLWLRTTGSTVVSQLIDSFVVLYIAFSGQLAPAEINVIALNNYAAKFVLAVALTPLCYLGHILVKRFVAHSDLLERQAEPMQDEPENILPTA